MSGNYAAAQVNVPANTPTQILAATVGNVGVRITYYPKVNGQLLYLGSSNAMTQATGYPILPGVEYQLPSITVALYAFVPKGGATVYVANLS